MIFIFFLIFLVSAKKSFLDFLSCLDFSCFFMSCALNENCDSVEILLVYVACVCVVWVEGFLFVYEFHAQGES